MVPEIWSMTNTIFCHFLPFYPPNNPENQNFEKLKKTHTHTHTDTKTPGDIIILHICTKNYDHMMYAS